MSHRLTPKVFNVQVAEAVDEGLEILGGEPVKQAFYYHIKKTANIERDEIPCNLKAFHAALTSLFYDGAFILEKRIARKLFARIGLEFEENDGWNLSDYVKLAQNYTGVRV